VHYQPDILDRTMRTEKFVQFIFCDFEWFSGTQINKLLLMFSPYFDEEVSSHLPAEFVATNTYPFVSFAIRNINGSPK
jgi:hypothetical protein